MVKTITLKQYKDLRIRIVAENGDYVSQLIVSFAFKNPRIYYFGDTATIKNLSDEQIPF